MKKFLLLYFSNVIIVLCYEMMIEIDEYFQNIALENFLYPITAPVNYGLNNGNEKDLDGNFAHEQFNKRLCLLRCFGDSS